MLFKQITSLDGDCRAKNQALDLIFAATIIAGVFQIIAGFLRLGSLMRFVSRSVIIGFVNALAILIFLAQVGAVAKAMGWDLHHWQENGLENQTTYLTFVFIALALAIIYLLPLVARPLTALSPCR